MIDPKLPTVALLFAFCVNINLANAQSDLTAAPYTVSVAQDGGYARCGPSNHYYRTDPLHHRQQLKVFVETADGWLGIQPVDDSFCWVPADAVELDRSKKSGTITEDRTPAWIGTHVEPESKNQWQVQLAVGEQVTVIGQSNRQGPDGPQLWYRIVPPSGEYRWVHQDQVARSPEPSMVRSDSVADDKSPELALRNSTAFNAERESLAEAVKENGLIALLGFQRRQTQPDDFAITNRLWVPDRSPIPLTDAPQLGPPRTVSLDSTSSVITPIQAGSIENTAGQSSALIQQASYQQPLQHPLSTPGTLATPHAIGSSIALPTVAAAAPPRSHLNDDRIAQVQSQVAGADIDQLTLILSMLMAREASAAETQPVILASKNLATGSPDSIARASQLADRALRYSQLAQRRDAATSTRADSGIEFPSQPMSQPPAIAASMQAGFATRAPDDVAVSGILVPVYSARADSPSFALTDSQGRTIAYVTPSPGINLRSQINTPVRVSGKQTFVAGLSNPVIIANHAATIR